MNKYVVNTDKRRTNNRLLDTVRAGLSVLKAAMLNVWVLGLILWEIEWADIPIIFEGYVTMALMHGLLAIQPLGFKRALGICDRMRPDFAGPKELRQNRVPLLGQVRWGVRSVSMCFDGAECLDQSMTAFILYSRRRIPVDLVIGVRDVDRVFQAHAWLEYDQEPLYDTPDHTALFRPIIRLSGQQGLISPR